MPNCVHCGAETEMYVRGVPVCVRCDNEFEKTKVGAVGVREALAKAQPPKQPYNEAA